MNTAIRFYTRSGNTKKLALAIADAISVEAKSVETPLEEKVDTLFLGCSYYAFDVDPAVKNFIESNKDKIGCIVLFGTSAMLKSMKKPVFRVTEPLGIKVAEKEFHCYGTFGIMHKGKPNEEDLKAVATFAKEIVG